MKFYALVSAFLILFSTEIAAETIFKPRSGAYTLTIPSGWIVHNENTKGGDVFIVPRGKRKSVIFTLTTKTRGTLDQETTRKNMKRIFSRRYVTINGAKCLHKAFENHKSHYGNLTVCRFKVRLKTGLVYFSLYISQTKRRRYNAEMEPYYWKVIRSLKFPRNVTPAR